MWCLFRHHRNAATLPPLGSSAENCSWRDTVMPTLKGRKCSRRFHVGEIILKNYDNNGIQTKHYCSFCFSLKLVQFALSLNETKRKLFFFFFSHLVTLSSRQVKMGSGLHALAGIRILWAAVWNVSWNAGGNNNKNGDTQAYLITSVEKNTAWVCVNPKEEGGSRGHSWG